jgi:ribosomal protein S16
MNNFYVYEHWRTDRDECFYVGKGRAGRAYDMKTRNRHHKAIQAKVSREGFAIEIRMVATGLAEGDAFALEIERIVFWRASGADLTNMTNGGEGTSGYHHSVEVRQKMSISQNKRLPRPPHSNETKKKISLKKMNNSNMKGKHHSQRVKDILSNLGYKNIEKFKQFSHLGPKALSKKVICLDDGKVYESASAASREYAAAKSAIIELCLGQRGRKTVNGLRFQYVGDE